jgi:trehalose synthase
VSALTEVPIAPASPERFRELVGGDYAQVEAATRTAGELLTGRVIWHVNSTARGGGVAEMLLSLLAYARGAGVDARWVTIDGNEEFFRVTKRIHNHLHGAPGDDGELGEAERAIYENTLAASAAELGPIVSPGDIVYLHDPQTAGLIESMRAREARVVWRCHIGLDQPNKLARAAWSFLHRYVVQADAYVFSREAFVWDELEEEKLWLVPPSIDAFSPKNQDMEPEAVKAIVAWLGLTEDGGPAPVFTKHDGSQGRVDRSAELDQDQPIPTGTPVVLQVSRWDRLKDPAGVLRAFAEHCSHPSAHLVLAGPSVADVADDPEGAEILSEMREQRNQLSPAQRARVHLACLPMDDVEENAAMVNAIQRRADVIVQKSLAEGFGLTVAEAMWKAKPVVASRIGGIQDQIVDGESGILIDDPADLEATAAAIDGLLDDPARAKEMGAAARERIREMFLGTRHLVQYMGLIEAMLDARELAD